MNIVDAYKSFNGQLVIFITGLSGCGKTALGKYISNDFNIKLIEQINYRKQDFENITTLPNGDKVSNIYTDDAYEWEKLTRDINSMKKDGIVVVGISLPHDLLPKPDYHIHLAISKNICLERRKEYLEKNKDIYKEDFEQIGTKTEKLKMNQLAFPYYLSSIKRMKINKFLNIDTLSDTAVYDDVFDSLIKFIERYLYRDRFNQQQLQNVTDYSIPDTMVTNIEPPELVQPIVNESLPLNSSNQTVEETILMPLNDNLDISDIEDVDSGNMAI